MKQIRIITVSVSQFSPVWEKLGLVVEGVFMNFHEVVKFEKGYGLVIVGANQLKDAPRMTSDGLIVVDEVERVKAERALHSFADVIAVLAQSRRDIASPQPCIAFLPENDKDRA